MNRIAVYGSLRQECGNHSVLQDRDGSINGFVGKSIVKEYEMFSLGSFPGILSGNQDDEIVVEVYDVSDYTLKRVRALEGFSGNGNVYNMYNEEIVNTEFGEAAIYVWNGRELTTKVFSGDWVEYINNK